MAHRIEPEHPGRIPTIVSEPDGPFFARPVEYPDEGYPRGTWVVIHTPDGEHVGCGTEGTVMVLVDAFNEGLLKIPRS